MRPEKIEYANNLLVAASVRSVEQYPFHWHDALEIIYVLGGSVYLGIGDDNLLLNKGDIAIVNMGEIHRITKAGHDNKILHLHISPDAVKSILLDSRYLYLYCCSACRTEETAGRYQKLKAYVAQLAAVLNHPPSAHNAKETARLLQDMIAYSIYNFDLLRWGFGNVPLEDRRVKRLRKIAECISKTQSDKILLKDMLEEIDITLSHLSYDIKKIFGQSFQELLYYGKCEAAAKLLLGTGDRIIDIALNCGFSDVKYLIKHFKRFFGHTPSEFRRLHKADSGVLAAQFRYTEFPLSEAVQEEI